jgi:hypothetical protein
VAPHVLIDPDDLHTVQPAGIVDQHPSALGQDRVVSGVPRDAKPLGDAMLECWLLAGVGYVLSGRAPEPNPPSAPVTVRRPASRKSAGPLFVVVSTHNVQRVASADHRGEPPADIFG